MTHIVTHWIVIPLQCLPIVPLSSINSTFTFPPNNVKEVHFTGRTRNRNYPSRSSAHAQLECSPHRTEAAHLTIGSSQTDDGKPSIDFLLERNQINYSTAQHHHSS